MFDLRLKECAKWRHGLRRVRDLAIVGACDIVCRG
jgi:hypothetical protein